MRCSPIGSVAAAVLLAAASASCGADDPRPNVLLITIDTLRADHLGCYGYERGTSPEIDAFARGAVVFEQAQASAPWTLPALASLHTGLFSATHGSDRMDAGLDTDFDTLAETLRDAGYDTAMVACHVFLGPTYGLQQGFTHVDEDLVALEGDLARSISSPGTTERGLRFLENKARASDGVPWILWLHYFDPHADYLAHAGFSERFGTEREIDLYDGEIAFTDHHVGRLLRELARLGLDRNTIVVLLADHGEEFGEHGSSRHGSNLYQETVRVPLLVRAPGLASVRIAEPVGSVDVLPTVLELCALAPRRAIEGRSLLPLARHETSEPRELLMEVRWRAGQDLRALRRAGRKYCEHRQDGSGPDLLFDLEADPRELVDLRVADADAAAELRAHLARRLQRAAELARPYPPPRRTPATPTDARHLQGLGYVGEDSAPSAEPR